MSVEVYFLSIFLILGTILAIFGMRYYSANQQAKTRLASEDAYRAVAERAALLEPKISSIESSLLTISARLDAIEKVLKEVE